jgi:hypothetical protein
MIVIVTRSVRAVLQNHRSELQYEADEERLLASEPTVQHLTERMLDATCALLVPTENRSSVVGERPAARQRLCDAS